MHPAKFVNGKNAPGVLFHYKSLFFPAFHTTAISVRCFFFFVFLWFLCGIVSGSLVCCERLGAVKVKVHCGGRRQQMRYAEGGGCVTIFKI